MTKLRYWLAAVGLTVLSIFASPTVQAGDIPVAQRVYGPPPMHVVECRFCGLYVGGVFSVARGRLHEDPVPTSIFGTEWPQLNPNGYGAGVTVGFNQRWGWFVAGIEADVSWLNAKASREESQFGFTHTQSVRMPWYGTARLRAGVLPIDSLLLYLTAGGIFASCENTETIAGFGFSFTTSTKRSCNGAVVGIGAEWAFLRDWSLKLEWLHAPRLNAGHTTMTFAPGGPTLVTSADASVNLWRMGINWKLPPI